MPLASLPIIFLLSMSLFFGGYLIQFLGHVFEGSEPGELIVLRRLWKRRPSVVVVPAPPAQSGHSVA